MAHCVAQLYCAVLCCTQTGLFDWWSTSSVSHVCDISPTHAHTRKLQTQRCTSLVNNLPAFFSYYSAFSLCKRHVTETWNSSPTESEYEVLKELVCHGNLFANFSPFFFKQVLPLFATMFDWRFLKKEEITSSFIRFVRSGTSSQFSLHGPIFSTNISLCTSITWTLPHFWVGPFPLKLGKTWD